jgi:alpha-L-fucosidase
VERDQDMERFKRDYFALNRTFNPVDFDPAPWAEAAELAGMKYVVFTTKHHDGFSMFDTRQTDYRVTHPDCPFSSNPRANIAKEVFDAFRARGFGVGTYFSKSDWHVPYYWAPGRPAKTRNPNYDTHAEPELWEKFVQFVHAQIEELMTGYGSVDILWLDGGQVRPPNQDIRMDEIAAMGRRHQPGLIMADRTVGGRNENYLTPEQEVPDDPILDTPWESCITMGDQWSYKPDDRYKSTRDLIHLLVGVVAKGGNLLLNVGPSPQGTLPAEALSRMREIGDWMEISAEAIHGSRPLAPYAEGKLRFTQRGGDAYAIYLADEGETMPGAIDLPMAPASEVALLGASAPLSCSGRTVTMPAVAPCDHAWTLKFALA